MNVLKSIGTQLFCSFGRGTARNATTLRYTGLRMAGPQVQARAYSHHHRSVPPEPAAAAAAVNARNRRRESEDAKNGLTMTVMINEFKRGLKDLQPLEETHDVKMTGTFWIGDYQFEVSASPKKFEVDRFWAGDY